MSKLKSNHQTAMFEIKEQSEDSIIYQRVISPKGRSKKQIKMDVEKLPTATLHVFTPDEFELLKAIESDISSKMEVTTENKSIKERLFELLEI